MLTRNTDPVTAHYLPILAPEVAQLAPVGAQLRVIATSADTVALEASLTNGVIALITTGDSTLSDTRAQIATWSVTVHDSDTSPPVTVEVPASTGFTSAWRTAMTATRARAAPELVRPLVLVSCGAGKRDHCAPAAQLYVGHFFAATMRAAKAIADEHDIQIVSALHGLVGLSQVLAPYDVRLRRGQRAQVAGLIGEQADRMGLLDRPVVVLGGRIYVETVTRVWPHAFAPLAGTGGIGFQRARLSRLAAPPHASRGSARGVTARK